MKANGTRILLIVVVVQLIILIFSFSFKAQFPFNSAASSTGNEIVSASVANGEVSAYAGIAIR